MYGRAYRVNGVHGLMVRTHSFVEIFHDRFAQMWLNFVDTALKFLLQDVGGRGLVGINLMFQKRTSPKNPKPLNRKIWVTNSDHQNGKLHAQEMSHAVI